MRLSLTLVCLVVAIGIGLWIGRRRRSTVLGSDVTRRWLHEQSYDREGDRE